MSSNESMHEDSLPRNAPRPSVTVTEAYAKPVVPEVSLIFDKPLNIIENIPHTTQPVNTAQNISPTFTSKKVPISEFHSKIQAQTTNNSHQSSASRHANYPTSSQQHACYTPPEYRSSLPYKSYSAFRKSSAGNVSPQNAPDLSRKQVRFDTSSPTIYYRNNENNTGTKTTHVDPKLETPVVQNGTTYYPFKPCANMSQTRAIYGGNCRKLYNDENENCTSACCLSPRMSETTRIFELVRRQGDQIRLLQHQIERLQEELGCVRTSQIQEFEEFLKVVQNIHRPTGHADKSIQCRLDEEITSSQTLEKQPSFGCQVNFIPTTSMERSNLPESSTPPREQDRQNTGGSTPNKIFYRYPPEEEPIESQSDRIVKEFIPENRCDVLAALPSPKTDRSLAMYALTLKYLPQDKIKELVSKDDKNDIPTQSPADMSLASLRYLEKYGLTRKCGQQEVNYPPKFGNKGDHQGDNNNFLDVTAIKKQPKLL